MGRDDGFQNADISVRLLDDTKIRELLRNVPDETARLRAIVVYIATVLDSWGEGARVLAADAAPVWLSDRAAAIDALKAARLLDADGRVPGKAWEGWFGIAETRRADSRRKWREYKGAQRRRETEARVSGAESRADP